MGFSLKKALGTVATVGGIVAAPFTGGASLAVTAAGIGALAGESAQNQAKKDQQAAIDAQTKAQQDLLNQQIAAQQKLGTPNSTNLSGGIAAPINTGQPAANLVSPGVTVSTQNPPPPITIDYTPILIGGVAVVAALFLLLKKR